MFNCKQQTVSLKKDQTVSQSSLCSTFLHSCIHNLFIYCSSALGNSSNYFSSRLLFQKRAARLLLDADFSQPSVSLFSNLKWLPIFDLIKLRKLVLLFTILNNPDAPLCLKRKFNSLSSVRSTGLRTRACAYNLHVPYLGLILESAHLLTLLPLFLIALTLTLSKQRVHLLLLLFIHLD